ncbi:SDR family NAD(P)-dependent oxidoreductase [Nocardioides marmotae]|uniref:SDR family NAD(P)-dependent oxidoreductase n=1 Tax=Nocardioides marmotae TaxID=2663857 RepID=UPI001320B68C|nr:SDR family NAD(P)-dependent oxidoreductase [Nocardioides marmotae]MBC9732751.1 SDR family NAD(P)-dependent oxidoreductase [Nocardioides marmotae]MTB83866.1 SDR family NAD(P)-dependent oxidoreductase [Nocardioides marmotae]
MLLRWKLGVVVGGGSGAGHEVCLRLARSGCGVLVIDPDAAAAEATAEEVRRSRVSGWSLQADPAGEPGDDQLVTGRARDLGGADLLVTVGLTAPAALDLGRGLAEAPVLVPGPRDLDPSRTASAVLTILRAAEPGAVVVL